MVDYNEIILQAIDTVISGRLNNLGFDKTIKCKIVDDIFKSEGKYTVSDGTVKMEAYCDTADKYAIGDQVYVTVPLGDYTQRKVILSKYTENDNLNPITYVSPLDTIMDISGNLLGQQNISVGILANENEHTATIKPIFDIKISEFNMTPEETVLYDTIGLSADFYTKLDDLDVQRGNYGLCIELIEKTDEPIDKPTTMVFDSSMMFGNPYAFNIPLTQSIKIYKGDKAITGIKGYLYQNNNFQYYDHVANEYKPYPSKFTTVDPFDHTKTIDRIKELNINVSNINIYLGMDTVKLTDDTFKLYVNDGEEYEGDSTTKIIHSLWINKNPDTNEFIGFSDGVVDENYSEEIYLDIYEQQYAGAQVIVGDDGKNNDKDIIIPQTKGALQIYANAKSITQELKRLKDYIENDIYLYGILTKLQKNLQAYGISLIDDFNSDPGDQYWSFVNIALKNLEVLSGIIGSSDDEAKKLLIMETDYIAYLKDYFIYINDTQKTEPKLTDFLTKSTVYFKEITDGLNTLRNENNFQDFNPNVNGTLMYKLIYGEKDDTFEGYPNIKTYVEQVWLQLEQINKLIDTAVNKIETYITAQTEITLAKEDKPFREEYNDFIEANKNRYCMYWYHYNKDYVNETKPDRFLSKNWERINFTETPVPGMPNIIEDDLGQSIYTKTSEIAYITSLLNPELAEERYKAILFFNHARFEAEIVFKNIGEIPSSIDGDLNGALYIEVGESLDTTEDGKAQSMASHQLYNSYYTLLKASDGYINRKIRIRYDGVQGKDEMLAGTQAFWYVPTQATMLRYDETRLINEGFSHLKEEYKDTDDYGAHYRSGYECFYKNIHGEEIEEPEEGEPSITTVVADTFFWYQIAKVYNPTLTNNSIICKVVKEGFEYETSYLFTFSTYGNNGTDYTLSIVPAENQSAVMPEYDGGGDLDGSLKLKTQFIDYNGNAYQDVIVTPGWEGPHSWGFTTENNIIEIVEPNQGEDDSRCLYNVLKVSAPWGKISENIDADQTLTLTAFYPVPYSSGYYYIDGASTVIYNSQGALPQYYNGAYKIYNRGDNSEVKNVRWGMLHYDKNGKCILEQTVELGDIKWKNKDVSNEGQNENVENLPGIPNADLIMEPQMELPRISYNSTTKEYKLIPLSMYISNSEIYSVAICKSGDTIIFAQPIYIGQNRYGSPMLNSWDEGLQIDKDNNTILTAMIGAGYKDENNAFHGIVMGDVQSKLNEVATTKTGLYGFHAGAQSFGWLVDGTGFIGKSGRGRIEFDGNKGIIKSASYCDDAEKQITAGTLIDLDDGKIILKGAKQWLKEDGSVDLDENGLPKYISDGTQSCIKLDVQSPYFVVTSAQGKDLVHIGDGYTDEDEGRNGTDHAMFIQSNNYISTSEATDVIPAAGMKIDLNAGHIDAYNFKLTSAGIQMNSNPNDGDNYFYIGDTDDYIKYTKAGSLDVKLRNADITSSSFNLTAGDWATGCIVINSNPSDGRYLAIGIDNYIGDAWESSNLEDRKKESYLIVGTNGVEIKTQNFWLDPNGNVTMTGTVNAIGGIIGGWNMNKYKLYGGTGTNECCAMQIPGYLYDGVNKTKWVFAAGADSHDNYGTAPFRVQGNGNTYVRSLTMTGTLSIGTNSINLNGVYIRRNANTTNLLGFYTSNTGVDRASLQCNAVYASGRVYCDSLEVNGYKVTIKEGAWSISSD